MENRAKRFAKTMAITIAAIMVLTACGSSKEADDSPVQEPEILEEAVEEDVLDQTVSSGEPVEEEPETLEVEDEATEDNSTDITVTGISVADLGTQISDVEAGDLMVFINDELSIQVYDGTDTTSMYDLATENSFVITGYSEETNTYTVVMDEAQSLEKLERLCESLEQSKIVEDAVINYATVNEDGTIVREGEQGSETSDQPEIAVGETAGVMKQPFDASEVSKDNEGNLFINDELQVQFEFGLSEQEVADIANGYGFEALLDNHDTRATVVSDNGTSIECTVRLDRSMEFDELMAVAEKLLEDERVHNVRYEYVRGNDLSGTSLPIGYCDVY